MFWSEFLIIAVVHILALASPGPDFAIILRYAIRYGRKTALIASVGIGCAILLHVTYSLVGIAVIIKTTPWLFQLMTFTAALYLAWLGIGALRSQPPAASDIESNSTSSSASVISAKRAFWTGVMTNGLNPKATLFFLSLFAVIISADTPMNYKVIYGVYMAIATAAWFAALSLLLTRQQVRQFLLQKGYWFDRVMGLVLLLLALQLVISHFGESGLLPS